MTGSTSGSSHEPTTIQLHNVESNVDHLSVREGADQRPSQYRRNNNPFERVRRGITCDPEAPDPEGKGFGKGLEKVRAPGKRPGKRLEKRKRVPDPEAPDLDSDRKRLGEGKVFGRKVFEPLSDFQRHPMVMPGFWSDVWRDEGSSTSSFGLIPDPREDERSGVREDERSGDHHSGMGKDEGSSGMREDEGSGVREDEGISDPEESSSSWSSASERWKPKTLEIKEVRSLLVAKAKAKARPKAKQRVPLKAMPKRMKLLLGYYDDEF